MCSIGEEDFDDDGGLHSLLSDAKEVQDDSHSEEFGAICRKCNKPGAIYKLQFREAECCDCFLQYVRHKFRAALGSSKVLPKGARVLLIFDGRPESMVLLDMLHEAQTKRNFKKLHCAVSVLYIDDFMFDSGGTKTLTEYENFFKSLVDFLSIYKEFESFVLPLTDIQTASKSICNLRDLRKSCLLSDNERKFSDMVTNIKSLTSRQDFIKHHFSKLIANTAEKLNCQFAFKADYNALLATDLLTAVCLGRGASAALDVSLIDNRLENDIKLIRPLKDLSEREIHLYLKARQLTPLRTGTFDDLYGEFSSLQNLTKSFIGNIQKNFTSTVSTIARVGDKITENRDLECKRCIFCKSILDYKDSPTLLAIDFSHLACKSGKTENLNLEGSSSKSTDKGARKDTLCHGCQNIFNDGIQPDVLLETDDGVEL